jgi:peptidylprolyl isomerase domain and WD repeat-containing protein 1
LAKIAENCDHKIDPKSFKTLNERHRDAVTHCVATKTGFIVTASCDGHLKFWKKQDVGIEFVKHFRAHLGNIQGLAANVSGTLL